MRTERPFIPAAAIFVFAGALFACGSKSEGISASTGGSSGTGGQGGAGGATTMGGTSGFGGVTTSGGAIAMGGATASGGKAVSGGTVSTGGATATGGNSGSGGVTGSGGSGAKGGASGTGGGSSSGGSLGSGGAIRTGGAVGTGGAVATGGTSATVDCTDSSTTALSFTKQYENGSIAVTGSTKTYYTMTNWWHKFAGQTVKLDGLSMTLGNSLGTSVPSTDGNPMGFPTIFIGSYQNHTTVDSNLPMQVSAIKSVPTVFSTNASTLDTSNFNATYDVWFTSTNAKLGATASSPGTGGAYLMVWLYKPSARQPRGGVRGTTGTAPNYPGQTISGLPGTWDVWVDSTNPPCISYVSATPLDSLFYDLNNFIQDSVTNSYGITSSMYLSIVFAGFEVWSGGDGLQTKQFCAAVN
jgi:Glycosyl hydrolase family 12